MSKWVDRVKLAIAMPFIIAGLVIAIAIIFLADEIHRGKDDVRESQGDGPQQDS